MRSNLTFSSIQATDGREIPGGSRFHILDYSRDEDWAIIRVEGFTYKVRLKELEDATP